MMPSMLLVAALLMGILLLLTAVRPARSPYSPYELRRRKETGDPVGAAALKREVLLARMDALRQPVTALLLVILSLALVAGLGWLWGTGIAIIGALFYAKVASLTLFGARVRKLYRRHEEALLGVIARHDKKLRFLTGKTPEHREPSLGSREELLHLIAESGTVLSSDDKKLLAHALVFSGRPVADVMTGRDAIASIDHAELVGPLVLSDLHKTGHSCFPVVVNDVDHIVGMLDIRTLLTLEAKRSLTAAKAMTSRAFYIRGDQTLDHALAAFVRTRHHLLVVINREGRTLGLLSLRDVLEALLGRPIADEFASDGDLQLVAKRHL